MFEYIYVCIYIYSFPDLRPTRGRLFARALSPVSPMFPRRFPRCSFTEPLPMFFFFFLAVVFLFASLNESVPFSSGFVCQRLSPNKSSSPLLFTLPPALSLFPFHFPHPLFQQNFVTAYTNCSRRTPALSISQI